MTEVVLWRWIVTALLSSNLALAAFIYRGFINRLARVEVLLRGFVVSSMQLMIELHPTEASKIIKAYGQLLESVRGVPNGQQS